MGEVRLYKAQLQEVVTAVQPPATGVTIQNAAIAYHSLKGCTGESPECNYGYIS